MNQKQYEQFAEDFHERAQELMLMKNADYADPDSKQHDSFAVFGNLVACERVGISSTEQGFLVRLQDKLSRLANITKPDHARMVKDESVDDTLLDIINYATLFAAFRKCVKKYGRP